MARLRFLELLRSTSGAVAPTVALSLTALIAAGGLAFDYARVAALDTELQNAADQAALAAATQLDGKAGTCLRARRAAREWLENESRFANDGAGRAVQLPSDLSDQCDAAAVPAGSSGAVRFWQDDDGTVAATNASNARFVEVVFAGRFANYALTPIVSLFRSQDIVAAALAGVQKSMCKVPPVMICNPDEFSDPAFTISAHTGKGMLLNARDDNQNYQPGGVSFLNTGYEVKPGAAVLKKLLAQETLDEYECVAGSGVAIEPGGMLGVIDALNTRFDIYSIPITNAESGGICGKGQCPPAANSRKDVVRKAPQGQGTSTLIGSQSCDLNNGTGGTSDPNSPGWQVADAGTYLPDSLGKVDKKNIKHMGHPRDICHAKASPDCPSINNRRVLGDGNWDRDAFFDVNFNIVGSAAIQAELGTATPTRYQVYQWEQRSANLARKPAGLQAKPDLKQSPGEVVSAPICETRTTPKQDRRVLSVAVVNCITHGLTGRERDVPVAKWVDLFLVEPSVERPRTGKGDVYVELIGESRGDGPSGGTLPTTRSIPYLVK
jgi:Flp pilus assembly protein TadG